MFSPNRFQDVQETVKNRFEQSILGKESKENTYDKPESYYDSPFEEKLERSEIEETVDAYFDDLKEKSDCADTIPSKPFEVSDLRKISPEENEIMRDEFDDLKSGLKKEWEEKNGRPWPKYEHDVYSANGKLIRKAGSDYDAHHIQPLCLGGKNEVSNITPLRADVHYDRQGIHSMDSPYNKICNMVRGKES